MNSRDQRKRLNFIQFDLRDVYSDEDFLMIIKINTSVFLSKVDASYMDQVNFDIVAPPLFFKLYDYGHNSIPSRSSGSDSLLLCLGHFPTSYIKINYVKKILKFFKIIWRNKIRKNTLRLLQSIIFWFSDFPYSCWPNVLSFELK